MRALTAPSVWRVCLCVLALAACTAKTKTATTTTPVRPTQPARPRVTGVQDGLASWYGGKHHGGPTASGERFDKNAMTAAHRKLRMNTMVRVTNKRNGKTVVVRINDRGPYGRAIIDLSEEAARRLDMIEAGVVPVHLEVVK